MARKQRVIVVPEGSRRERILTATLATTTDRDRVMASIWMWGDLGERTEQGEPLYRLRVLGVLHTLFGLNIQTP